MVMDRTERGHLRDMNEIEDKFHDAFWDLMPPEEDFEYEVFELIPQERIGIYLVDFVYGDCVVEIDGHEYHKTKEQREKDYKKTRYLMKQGYNVIRFMGTEVFLDPTGCAMEMIQIADQIESQKRELWLKGVTCGEEKVRKCQTES